MSVSILGFLAQVLGQALALAQWHPRQGFQTEFSNIAAPVAQLHVIHTQYQSVKLTYTTKTIMLRGCLLTQS